MKYTSSQLIEITGLTRETIRYWRNILPPLQGKKGKAARYSTGDLLALLIIGEMVTTLEMNIAAIATVSQQIFDSCQGVMWHRSSSKELFIDIKNRAVSIVSGKEGFPSSSTPAVLIDMGAWHNKLRDLLIADEASQFSLPFSPQLVKLKSQSRR